MSSRDSTRAPAETCRVPSAQPLATTRTSRVRIKPRRDALTRVRHDLRSLVHAVVGYSNLLANEQFGPLGSQQKAFVSHVRSAASQLEALVDACVELSQSPGFAAQEVGSLTLDLLVSRLARHLGAHAITCDVTLPPPLAARTVLADVELSERALLELARVITCDATRPCRLVVYEDDGRIVATFARRDATRPERLVAVDMLENELPNREFVRLKLGEVLLARQATRLAVSPELDYMELTL